MFPKEIPDTAARIMDDGKVVICKIPVIPEKSGISLTAWLIQYIPELRQSFPKEIPDAAARIRDVGKVVMRKISVIPE